MQESINLTFCDEYGYPQQIKDQIEDIVTIFRKSDNIKSIILSGSAARGELSYKKGNDALTIFSDYEFFLVTDKKYSLEEQARLNASLSEYEHGIRKNSPLFKIDYSYTIQNRLSRLPKIIRNFELKQNGKTLWGHDYISNVPDISIKDLDYRDLNSIIYKRLWHVLDHLPDDLQFDNDEENLKYILCRNILDLTTIILPYQGILLPTYRRRIEWICGNFIRFPLFQEYFTLNLVDWLKMALAGKERVHFNIDSLELYKIFVRSFEGITAYLSASGQFGLNEWPRERHELKNIFKGFQLIKYQKGIGRSLSWLILPKKKLFQDLLFALHKALLAREFNREWKGPILLSKMKLELLHPLFSLAEEPSFPARWLGLRDGARSFWNAYLWGIYDAAWH